MSILERDDAGLTSVLRSHRDYYLALADRARPELLRAQRKDWMDRLSLEQGNLRHALTTSIVEADPGPGLRLAASLRGFWLARGLHAEGIAVLRELLARPGPRTRERGEALCALSQLTIESSVNVDDALASAEQAREIGLELGDRSLIVRALSYVSFCLIERDDFSGALATAEEALTGARSLGDPDLLQMALTIHAIAVAVAVSGGDPVPEFTEAAARSRANGDVFSAATALFNLGALAIGSGDTATARDRMQEALEIYRSLDQPVDIAQAEQALGFVHCIASDIAAARPRFANSLRVGEQAANLRLISLGLLGAALGATASEIAGRLHGAADAAIERSGLSVDPFIETLRVEDKASREQRLDARDFEHLIDEGRGMDEASAIALALSALG
jgi:tetratricopeptide (TPR) repeat protein